MLTLLAAFFYTVHAWDVARTPPMGFNTWNLYGCRVTGDILVATAQAMHDSGLQAVGYQYVNSDDCWMLANRTAGGDMIPNPAKFPNGFKAVADAIHALGLKSGLYTAKGTHTCGGFAASCGYEAQDAKLWASWGIDYVKDDSCSGCGTKTDNELYHTMWEGIMGSGREMVLTIEGAPDNSLGTQGGLGNAKRVGHDINPHFTSMTSLVDIGSGLWMYAHNSTNATYGGWWNDLDMVEAGNSPDFNCSLDAISLSRCQAHFSMWTIMKAPLLLGNDIPNESSATFSVVSNAAAISVNQDPLGVQGRRVAVFPPTNSSLTTLTGGAVAVFAHCDASRPTQQWALSNLTNSSSPNDGLYALPCDATNPLQRWAWNSQGGALQNVGTGQCLDRSAGQDPGRLVACTSPPTPAQTWAFTATGTKQIASGGGACLDVFNFQGPDVEIGGCKAGNDPTISNQQYSLIPGTAQIQALSTGLPPNSCLTASSGPPGGLVSTTLPGGEAWCLTNFFGSEGGVGAKPCPSPTSKDKDKSTLFTVVPEAGGGFALINGGGGLNANRQVGASGPWPYTRYTTIDSWNKNGVGLTFNPSLPSPQPFQLGNPGGLIDDDLVHPPSPSPPGQQWCLDLTTAGMLEVWVAPLVEGKFAATLFNRSPQVDSITLDWALLNTSDTQAFSVFSVWDNKGMGSFTGKYTAPSVPSQGVHYVILTPQ